MTVFGRFVRLFRCRGVSGGCLTYVKSCSFQQVSYAIPGAVAKWLPPNIILKNELDSPSGGW